MKPPRKKWGKVVELSGCDPTLLCVELSLACDVFASFFNLFVTRSHVLFQLLLVFAMLVCAFSTPSCLWDARMCFFNLSVIPNSSRRPPDCHWFDLQIARNQIFCRQMSKLHQYCFFPRHFLSFLTLSIHINITNSTFCYFCACSYCFSILAWNGFLSQKHFTQISPILANNLIRNEKRKVQQQTSALTFSCRSRAN